MDKKEFTPSYAEYRKILQAVKASGKCMDYQEALASEHFLILRHDIEFSVGRALKMALIEAEEGLRSTYFVQAAGDAYNPFSAENTKAIRQIRDAGHSIGLHYHLEEELSPHYICNSVRRQIQIMSEMLGFPIDRFSVHRPVEESHYYELEIDGVINAYSREFFTHMEKAGESESREVIYIADSKCRWNYGYPDLETFLRHPKIQLLIHPFSWSETGGDLFGIFNGLADEKEEETLDIFDRETKVYREIKERIEKDRKVRHGISGSVF